MVCGSGDKGIVSMGTGFSQKIKSISQRDKKRLLKKQCNEPHSSFPLSLPRTGSEKIEEVKLSSASCRVLPQPGDGSCLFHSMNHGLKGQPPTADPPFQIFQLSVIRCY